MEELKTASTFGAYLTGDSAVYAKMRYAATRTGARTFALSTWDGKKLATVTRLRKSWHNIGGRIYRYRAIDEFGQEWYGACSGLNMLTTMHKAKPKTGKATYWYAPNPRMCGRNPYENAKERARFQSERDDNAWYVFSAGHSNAYTVTRLRSNVPHNCRATIYRNGIIWGYVDNGKEGRYEA